MWLCNLMLKRGKIIRLATVADAYEFVPASFKGYFCKKYSRVGANILNTVDILKNWQNAWKFTVLSIPFHLYVVLDILTSSLGSAVIIILITDQVAQAMHVSPWIGLSLNVAPLLFFGISCIKKDQNFQVSMIVYVFTVYKK